MTEKQYKRVVKITGKLQALEDLRDQFASGKCHLTYAHKFVTGGSMALDERTMGIIDDILTCHDAMIRQEINDEIQKLKDEIAAI